jgi:hypothetical protein
MRSGLLELFLVGNRPLETSVGRKQIRTLKAEQVNRAGGEAQIQEMNKQH